MPKPKPPDDRREEFEMVLGGIAQTVTGRIVAQIGDPFQKMVYTFVKGEAGGNYMKRKGVCTCCGEVEEDWTMFESWEEIEDRVAKLWFIEAVVRGMCNEKPALHG